jgi:hypothetical protein
LGPAVKLKRVLSAIDMDLLAIYNSLSGDDAIDGDIKEGQVNFEAAYVCWDFCSISFIGMLPLKMKPIYGHCTYCAGVFGAHFPPTDTYLQRAHFIGLLPANNTQAYTCIMCYRKRNSAQTVDAICRGCIDGHRVETNMILSRTLLCRELVGRDCGIVIAGWLARIW